MCMPILPLLGETNNKKAALVQVQLSEFIKCVSKPDSYASARNG
jgi:hypothetical protein